MKPKNHYYVSRKNSLTWVMALCLVSSAVARIMIAVLKGFSDSLFMWGQIILPVAATLLYVYIVLKNGEERFYRTSVPIWMTITYFAVSLTCTDFSKKVLLLCWILLFIIGILYTRIANGTNRKSFWLVWFIACLTGVTFLKNSVPASNLHPIIPAVPDILLLLGFLPLVFALQTHPDGKRHLSWGDRADGRRVKSIPPMSQIIPYIMVNRNGATNSFSESLEISQVDKYIQKKRKEEGLTTFGITHVLLASYVRALCQYPALNRFIAGQKIYSRGDDIQFCMVIKKEMSADSPDTVIKVHLDPYDTAADIYNKMNVEVEKVKSTPLNSTFDHTAQAFTMIPSLLLKFTIWFLKTLDYFGLLPKFILEISPFHGSIFFTSMGSLGIPPIYHHLYDFGNLPVFVAFGCKRRAMEIQKNGSVVQKKYIDCKFTLDERIADGYYYAAFFKYFKRIFLHPEVLDTPPETVLQDID